MGQSRGYGLQIFFYEMDGVRFLDADQFRVANLALYEARGLNGPYQEPFDAFRAELQQYLEKKTGHLFAQITLIVPYISSKFQMLISLI